jgi:4a-hydroxytetrahydrobiopterin dehydratase
MTVRPLSDPEREQALAALPLWSFDDARNALFRRIQTADFATGFGLMTSIAIIAEKADHHPEWSNVYNRLDIWLTTHDAGGVSQRDVDLAHRIDQLAGQP